MIYTPTDRRYYIYNFRIKSNDNKIIGNIKVTLNENLKKFGGHIGYSIRPTERNKGYNKINLYLGLKICQEYKY